MLAPFLSIGQTSSIAREWNDLIIEAIRNDYARPTIHARNLYHHSIIVYDAWAVYDPSRQLYFLGNNFHGYLCAYDSISIPADVNAARLETISFASYRFIQNRYSNSPDYASTLFLVNNKMQQMGYDPSNTSTDYTNGGPAELGNYLAEQIQLYGYTDGSNEQNGFANLFYDQLNPPLAVADPGNPDIQDPNHWQPLSLEVLIDQSGNLITTTQPHLSPEWGEVDPFAMSPNMSQHLVRDGDTYNVYFDSLHPAFLNIGDSSAWESFYKWNHSLVSVWQSHLDTADGVMWDISPASIGNNTWYPSDSTEFSLFYDLVNGGDPGTGYTLNPVTGVPYTPQVVHRGDYARVLAEFWADGLDSETPPGHWFVIYHYVSDQPTFERKWKGLGPELDPLEYDVKAHLALGGTVHDAAICAWSLKGYYDYLRPVSAIRYMADQGQSSDINELNYDPNGIPLLSGFIEVVHLGDPLAGQWNQHVGKIKVYTWRGHEYITDPQTDLAGVGWILAENWWPYQRPTFVTPPFAGFVSGHSTFSRAAARTMEFITGSPYFPGGMGEFVAPMNEYLQFEEGPSDTIHLQWASYRDASDQCSLSRIWGGIHPPIDDMPGRKIGDVVGPMASLFADSIFSINHASLIAAVCSDSLINRADFGNQFTLDFTFNVPMDTSVSAAFSFVTPSLSSAVAIADVAWLDSFNLEVTLDVLVSSIEILEVELLLQNLEATGGLGLPEYTFVNHFIVDTRKPLLSNLQPNYSIISDAATQQNFALTLTFDETCDQTSTPSLLFSGTNYVNPTLSVNSGLSEWLNDSMYVTSFDVTDFNEFVDGISVMVSNVSDLHENLMDVLTLPTPFVIDTKNPTLVSVTPDDTLINQSDLASPQVTLELVFDKMMDQSTVPDAFFETQGAAFNSLIQNPIQTLWIDTNVLSIQFLIYPGTINLTALDLNLGILSDTTGNLFGSNLLNSVLWSDLKSPEVLSQLANKPIISDSLVGASNYFVDITFNEPMDTTVNPLVLHTATQSISSSVQYNVPLSHYIDSFTFRAFFQILDENKEVAPIDLEVQFAQDFAGNTQNSFSYLDFTSLDTKNPSVLSVYANHYALDEWGQSFEVLAIYDETMQASVYPELTFSPIVPVGFPNLDSLWTNGINFKRSYQLQGSPVQTTIFDIAFTGGVDLAGNVQHPINIANFFEINPILGLNEQSNEPVYLYPTLLGSGDHLTLIGASHLGENAVFECMSALGQKVTEISFYTNGNKHVSEAIYLSSGLYYLRSGDLQFKIVVK